MLAAEKPIEALARTVTCPVCGAPPRRPCKYPDAGYGGNSFRYSHTGRLEKARGLT